MPEVLLVLKFITVSDLYVQVAEIQDRIRNGYYIKRGLGSVKEDISRMCRDAIKYVLFEYLLTFPHFVTGLRGWHWSNLSLLSIIVIPLES